MSSSGGKEIDEIDSARNICLLYKLKSPSRASDDLSIGFYRKIEAPERKSAENIESKGQQQGRIYLNEFFGF